MYLLTHACPQGPKFGNKVSVFCILYSVFCIASDRIIQGCVFDSNRTQQIYSWNFPYRKAIVRMTESRRIRWSSLKDRSPALDNFIYTTSKSSIPVDHSSPFSGEELVHSTLCWF